MATTASKDGNSVSSLICASSSDGLTIVPVKLNTSTNGLKVDNNITGTDFGGSTAVKDTNSVSVLMATSSADGITPVEVYALDNGNILINSL